MNTHLATGLAAASALAVTALGVTADQFLPDSSAVPATPAASPTPADRAHRDLLDHGPDAKVLTVSHRGQWRKAPENSLPAIDAAFDDGAEIVEIDVQRTRDGQLVLMHDDTVDRTTNGTGRVFDLTLAQLRDLRLRRGLGGAQAALTDQRVPTLAEALRAVKDRGLVDLDKSWPIREEVYRVLEETGTVRNGMFVSAAPVPEVQEFRKRHPGVLYQHALDDTNIDDIDAFGADQPQIYGILFDSAEDAVVRPPVLAKAGANSRIWYNTMWVGMTDHFTDERSLIDPRRGWAPLLDTYRGSMVQTDDVESFESWLRTGEGDPQPRRGVRIQAEDFRTGGEGVAYHDTEPENQGRNVARLKDGVDVCDTHGAVVVCWIRGGEWLSYDVTVPRAGRYALSVRASSPYDPAGTYRVTVDDGQPSAGVPVRNTTNHRAFALQPSGVTPYLTAGQHRIRISLDADAYQNFNLDYLQLDPVRG